MCPGPVALPPRNLGLTLVSVCSNSNIVLIVTIVQVTNVLFCSFVHRACIPQGKEQALCQDRSEGNVFSISVVAVYDLCLPPLFLPLSLPPSFFLPYLSLVLPLQRYIQHKQEERRKKQQEARSAQEQKRQEREKRLRELYQRQKCSLAANLRQREKEREAYCRALTSSSAAEVHIHIHDSTSSVS